MTIDQYELEELEKKYQEFWDKAFTAAAQKDLSALRRSFFALKAIHDKINKEHIIQL